MKRHVILRLAEVLISNISIDLVDVGHQVEHIELLNPGKCIFD